MKKVLMGVSALVCIALAYCFFSNHYYYLLIDAPQTNPIDVLDIDNIYTLQGYIDFKNQSKDFPLYPNEYTPIVVGMYNGINIEEQYWCSDLCPDNGILYLNYSSSSEETCENIGGSKLYKWGWGSQYVGCSPIKNKFSE